MPVKKATTQEVKEVNKEVLEEADMSTDDVSDGTKASILAQYNYQESDIPVNSIYWKLKK